MRRLIPLSCNKLHERFRVSADGRGPSGRLISEYVLRRVRWSIVYSAHGRRRGGGESVNYSQDEAPRRSWWRATDAQSQYRENVRTRVAFNSAAGGGGAEFSRTRPNRTAEKCVDMFPHFSAQNSLWIILQYLWYRLLCGSNTNAYSIAWFEMDFLQFPALQFGLSFSGSFVWQLGHFQSTCSYVNHLIFCLYSVF